MGFLGNIIDLKIKVDTIFFIISNYSLKKLSLVCMEILSKCI